MLVRMIGEVSGTRDGAPWPGVGRDIDLPSDEAAQLIQARMAIPAVDPELAVQRAVAPTVAVEERGQAEPAGTRTEQRSALVRSGQPKATPEVA
jgi:hypothetical protein